MIEAIVTLVVPATDDEPAHTEIVRMEFEGKEQVEDWFRYAHEFQLTVNMEKMTASTKRSERW